MLWTVISCVFLWWTSVGKSSTACPLFGTTPTVSSGTNNYAVDWFQDELLFAFAIDQCTATSFVPSKWYKYQCVQQAGNTSYPWKVTKTGYSSSSCSGTGSVDKTYNNWDLQCTGDNTYGKVELSTSSTCAGAQVVYAALSGCLPNLGHYTKFYCDNTNGYVHIYLNQNFVSNVTTDMPYENCDPQLYCTRWFFTSTCTMVGAANGVPFYGKIDSCLNSISTTSTTGSASKKSAYLPFCALLNIIFAFVTLFVVS